MATNNKNFVVKNGLIVGDSTNLVNYSSASPSGNFLGQLWISASSLYAWSSASTWVLVGDGNSGGSLAGPVASANFALFANTASSINWTGVTGTPTTVSGYGITDAMPVSASAGLEEVSYSANAPSSPPVGYIWIESDVDVSTQTYHAAYSASAPYAPILGDLWVDSSEDVAITASNLDGGSPESVYIGILNGALDAGGA